MRDGDRRLSGVEKRLDFIDQYGTRGVEALRDKIEDQGKDIAKIENKLDIVQRSLGFRQAAIYLAMVLPVYVLLFVDIVKR